MEQTGKKVVAEAPAALAGSSTSQAGLLKAIRLRGVFSGVTFLRD
jgi:hypothetical protein